MTIQEAIKSGKPFKHSDLGDEYYLSVHRSCKIVYYDNKEQVAFFAYDLLEDDWEVKE